jgi:hypothetical protein
MTDLNAYAKEAALVGGLTASKGRPSADAAVRKIVAEYQITDPEILKRLAARPAA